jgi:AcrR family transcriptional regulator
VELPTTRSARSRQAIIEAATEVFLRHGYVGATTDEVASRASVSKQTVYKQFGDKQRLFAEIIMATTADLVDTLSAGIAAALDEPADLRTAFRDLARMFLRGLLRTDTLRLRRLVIGEADRFPDVGRAWYDRAVDRTLVLLGEAFDRLAERGLLHDLADPTLAAYQFAGLVLYQPQTMAMFAGTDSSPDPDRLSHIADAAADVFLARYAARP